MNIQFFYNRNQFINIVHHDLLPLNNLNRSTEWMLKKIRMFANLEFRLLFTLGNLIESFQSNMLDWQTFSVRYNLDSSDTFSSDFSHFFRIIRAEIIFTWQYLFYRNSNMKICDID